MESLSSTYLHVQTILEQAKVNGRLETSTGTNTTFTVVTTPGDVAGLIFRWSFTDDDMQTIYDEETLATQMVYRFENVGVCMIIT